MRAFLEFEQALADLVALLRQQPGIDQDAGTLHAEEHVAHRYLDLFVDPPQAGVAVDLRLELLLQAQAEVGVLGGVGCRLVDRHLLETDLLRALAAKRFVGDRLQPEVAAGELAEVVPADAVAARFEDVGLEQRVVPHAGEADAVVGEDVLVVLQVLADLRLCRVFEPRLQASQHGVLRQL